MNMWGAPNRSKQDAAEYELKQRIDRDVPKSIEHAEQVQEAQQARKASGYRVRWRVAWAQLVGFVLVAAIVGGALFWLAHR